MSLLPTLTPCKTCNFVTCLTSPANPSITIKNKKGASGSSCLNPLVGLNSSMGLPFCHNRNRDGTTNQK